MNQNDLFNNEVIEMMQETAKLIEKEKMITASSITSGLMAEDLSHSVSLGKRLFRFRGNYGNIKGHTNEMDFVRFKRFSLKNLFSRVQINSNPHKQGYDAVKTDFFTGKKKLYEIKSSKIKKITNPDVTVVTPDSRLSKNKNIGMGHESFRNEKQIAKRTSKVHQKIQKGALPYKFTVGNVIKASAISAGISIGIAVTIESIFKYKSFKNGDITQDEYLKSIIVKGSKAGTTGFVTTGVMIPVTTVLAITGTSGLLVFPISFLIGGQVYKLVEQKISKHESFVLSRFKKLAIRISLANLKKRKVFN